MKPLKCLLTLSLLFLMGSASALNFDKTFVYGFKLPKELKAENVIGKIKYNVKLLVPKKRWIAGKFQNINQNFSYTAIANNKVENITLPIQLLADTYYWLLDADMLTEMALHPNRYQIEISSNDKSINYDLPISFDFLPDNALNISYLKSLKTAERNNLLQQKTWTLTIAPKIEDMVKDTILVYSISKLPKGIALLVKDINLKPHSNQEFNIENVLCYKKELFFYIPAKAPKKPVFVKSYPDQCIGMMTDINGNIGYASGCITGMGSGKCSGILSSRETKKYNLTLIIEPY